MTFQMHWISTGVATMRKTEPRLSLFSATLPMDSPPPGAIHIRCCGALAPGTSRKPASSGWALSNHGVRPDGVEEELRRAHGAVPAKSECDDRLRRVCTPAPVPLLERRQPWQQRCARRACRTIWRAGAAVA